MVEVSDPPVPPAPVPGGRAGRNIPVAIGIGLGLGALVLLTLYLYKPVFLAVVVIAIAIGLWEFVRGVSAKGLRPTYPPLLVGASAILCTSYTVGRETMTDAMLLTIPLIVVWRAPRGIDGLLGDLSASLLALVYIGFLAGFCGLMLAAPDGDDRVTCFVATVVASDVGGLAAGLLFGKHSLAPRISPKKSWEGLAGSAVLCALIGFALCVGLLDAHWWQGVVFGLALVTSATLGDLGASMLKRDLAIKDWGTLLPAHGGLLDRLDSLLPSAPVAWAILAAFVPVH